eukprot:IDg17170t1
MYSGEVAAEKKMKKSGTTEIGCTTSPQISNSSFCKFVKALSSCRNKQHSGGSTIIYTLRRLAFQYLRNISRHLKVDIHAKDCKTQLENRAAVLDQRQIWIKALLPAGAQWLETYVTSALALFCSFCSNNGSRAYVISNTATRAKDFQAAKRLLAELR